jgi:uncharacterized protein YcaQ
MTSLTVPEARRLALARAGLLKPEWTGFPQRANGQTAHARRAALQVIGQFGYLQLDTVAIAGARSHTIVLLSRLEGLNPICVEELLQPGSPLFEYWGHEASWIPISLYPLFGFRRNEFHHHPWWGDIIGQNPTVAKSLLRRIRNEGPLRSLDMEGKGGTGWWNLKTTKQVASAYWSSGELAVRERKNFQKVYDLTERVIPQEFRNQKISTPDAIRELLLLALNGHGWATTGTLARTWRLRNRKTQLAESLQRLCDENEVVPCELNDSNGKTTSGWIRPADLELAARLRRVRPQPNKGVLLSPFDPALWDRPRVKQLFGFDQVLEIFKQAAQRVYGYYCLPVLAGERLVGRFDLKADSKAGTLRVLSCRMEPSGRREEAMADREAAKTALTRYATALKLSIPRYKFT